MKTECRGCGRDIPNTDVGNAGLRYCRACNLWTNTNSGFTYKETQVTEPCIECGEEYPAHIPLIHGHIMCQKCMDKEQKRITQQESK